MVLEKSVHKEVRPKSKLLGQVKKLPDLAEEFQDHMIAEHLDGIFDDLLRFQHPDYPCYVNGEY